MNTIIILLLIQVCLVLIMDLSGFVDEMKKRLWTWMYPTRPYKAYSFKPWDCSLCMTHHIGLLYLIIWGKWSLMTYAALLALALLTTTTKNLIILIKDALDTIIYKLQVKLSDKV